jgi:DNA-binding PadR family transcriptional regulator
MNLLSILGGNAFVMFNKDIAREVSVNAAIIFGQLCSSYESFKSKEMITKKNGKEYFYLTSETIEEETALTYKQQLKAIKDLEEAGYIETVLMGQRRRKYFHITDEIFEQFQVSSDKREDLKKENNTEEVKEIPETQEDGLFDENSRYDKRETLEITKGNSADLPFGIAYKNINKKEIYINNKINKNHNSNLNHIDIYELLWDTDLPMTLKQRIKIMIRNNEINLQPNQLLEIEDAYKYQISKGFIIPDCSLDDIEAINDFEFTNTICKMLTTVKNIYNMRGMIKEWVEQAYTYKKDQYATVSFGTIKNPVFYNWLEEDSQNEY